MSDNTGGTVTYHRADWIGEKIKPVYPWMVQFVEDGPIHELTRAEGEAMGLTVPEPAPLVVECRGHRIELDDEQARLFVETWAKYDARYEWDKSDGPRVSASLALAGLLRDARQDPQPTADSEPWPWGDEGYMCPKMVRETLCVAQAAVNDRAMDTRRAEHSRRIQQMLDWCDRHRPIGPDGKHGTRRCTPTCGCEDKREPITPVRRTVDSFTILDPKPAPPVATVEIGGQVMTQAQYDAVRFPLLNPDTGPIVDTPSQPCPACNDEGVVHTYDGLPIGPCDCAATVDIPSDDIDFDALPIGTVLRGKRTDSRYCVVKTNTGEWTWASDDVGGPVSTAPIEWRIVHQPPVLSPRQHLEALLAGRDDADEMLSRPRTWSAVWMDVVAAAARGGA